MDPEGEPRDGTAGLTFEELPQMDGSCDACEPDEAQLATQVCRTCSFAFCSAHAESHSSRTHHLLTPYDHETEQANGLGADCGAEGGAEGGSLWWERDQGAAPLGEMDGDAGAPQVPRQDDQTERGGAAAAGDAPKRDTVTVERLRCKEHGQEGSLYCKVDERIICVVCAVQGEHREHEIITLHEAYMWQKVRETQWSCCVTSTLLSLSCSVRHICGPVASDIMYSGYRLPGHAFLNED